MVNLTRRWLQANEAARSLICARSRYAVVANQGLPSSAFSDSISVRHYGLALARVTTGKDRAPQTTHCKDPSTCRFGNGLLRPLIHRSQTNCNKYFSELNDCFRNFLFAFKVIPKQWTVRSAQRNNFTRGFTDFNTNRKSVPVVYSFGRTFDSSSSFLWSHLVITGNATHGHSKH